MAVLAALTIAALTLLVHRTLRTDPLGWLRWGHELTRHGTLDTKEYPSWKPLALLFTGPLALTGSLAPMLWLVIARASAFLTIGLVFRLAGRLGGRVAAVVAVIALVLVPGYWPTLLGGQIEPMILTLVLLAIERHCAGRPLQALGLATLAALGREEVWPFLALYAVYLLWRQPGCRLAALGVIVLVPALWLGGDWIGSGDPLHGGVLAKVSLDAEFQRATSSTGHYAVQLVGQLFLLPVWGIVMVGLATATRRRDGLLLALVAIGVVWAACDVVIAHAGYPSEPRFLIPAAGVLSIAAGAGAAELVRLVRRWDERLTKRRPVGLAPTAPAQSRPRLPPVV